jgi:cytoplasmic iron level regulating protein YaaA (DUF328/UPF0246 family)
MIILLAPSKTMNFQPVSSLSVPTTMPHFYAQAVEIVHTVCQMDDLAPLMRTSRTIADKTKSAYARWGEKNNPSLYAYVGDVYKGFYAPTLTSDGITWAQKHVFILSGLYGALRPLDLISAYRLEMKAKLPVGPAKNLYEFWGNKVAKYVDDAADGVICVLSSDEYAKVVTAHTGCRVITPVFLDKKPNGMIGTVPIYSKMMRGVMARWLIDNHIDTPERIIEFSMYGYSYDAGHSIDDRPAFYREVMTPLRFN